MNAIQNLQNAITDGTAKNAEPGEILTRVIDILATKPTKNELETLKKFGFKPVSKERTHFSNDDDTLVKFTMKGKSYWMQVETDSYEFSLHNKLSNFIEQYENADVEA